jgi:hypothetical protein
MWSGFYRISLSTANQTEFQYVGLTFTGIMETIEAVA